MKEGYYVIKTCVSGMVGEKTKYFVPGKRPDKNTLSRRQKNALRKQEQNEYSALKNLARGINANYSAGDLLMGLDYSDNGLARVLAWGRKNGLPVDSEDEEEKRNAVWEAAAHELEIALRRVKRRLKKQNIELKAYYCTSDMDGKTGELVRVHHHLVVNAGVQDAFLDAWKKYGLGGVAWSELWANQIDRTPIAQYLLDQVRRIPDAKKFRHTRNVAQSIVKNRIVYTDNELQVPRGGKLIYRQEYKNNADSREEFRGYQPQYIRYITPEALRKLDAQRETEKDKRLGEKEGPEDAAPLCGTAQKNRRKTDPR